MRSVIWNVAVSFRENKQTTTLKTTENAISQ